MTCNRNVRYCAAVGKGFAIDHKGDANMARPKNNPDFNRDRLESEVFKMVVDIYMSADNKNHEVSFVADALDMSDLKAYIEKLGGFLRSAVSSKTDYLICNDPNSNSTKSKKAKELGVPVITEEEFLRMANEKE